MYTGWLSYPGLLSVGVTGRAFASLHSELGASGLVPLGAVAHLPRAPIAPGCPSPGGPFGMAGGARGWVAGRAGLWGVLPTWAWVGGTSPHVSAHPTSICNIGVK